MWFLIILAPGDYCPENSDTAVLDNGPKYSFGAKGLVKKTYITPGILNHFIINYELGNQKCS